MARTSAIPRELERIASDGFEFSEVIRGRLIGPEDPAYDHTRSSYNGMIDRRPALIVRCADVADVISAVRLARETGVDLAVRGGGHGFSGLGSVDDGLVIDLGNMNSVQIDPEARTARVEGGALVGDLDHAAEPFGLATPAGVISTTGLAGLTLGGGHGYLTRKHGLTIDNLVSANVVLANGEYVKASEDLNPDLFWALRGGGGNFGVVTELTLRLHPTSTVVGGPTLWPLEAAPDVLRWYREFQPAAPDDIYGFFALVTVPPAPPFPTEIHNQKACGIVWCFPGPPDAAAAALAPALEIAEPLLHGVQEMPYTALQSMFDALYPPGLQWYIRGDFVNEIPDEAVERHLKSARRMPTALSGTHIYPIDGAASRVGPGDTAFAGRDAKWSQVIYGVDPDPAMADQLRTWTVDYWEAVHPYAARGAYINFLMDEGRERIAATYGDNYARLSRIKTAYDPTNLFHVNQNIRPVTG